MKISERWQSELIGTDDRWGNLYVSNATASASVVPSVSGTGFMLSLDKPIPLLPPFTMRRFQAAGSGLNVQHSARV
jgi:hypothetical protein